MNRKTGFWVAGWLVLVVLTGFLAFGRGWGPMAYGPAYGWGHMGGWDEDYRSDAAPGWYGMGPGMMGGRGTGRAYGMMGPYGMSGMGAGMGPGMAGGAYAMLPWILTDLTPEQTQKIGALLNAPENRNVLQQRWEAQAGLARLYAAEKRDWNAIRAAAMAVSNLQRQQLEAALDMQQKVDALLTDSQRQAMARAQRSYGWMGAQ